MIHCFGKISLCLTKLFFFRLVFRSVWTDSEMSCLSSFKSYLMSQGQTELLSSHVSARADPNLVYDAYGAPSPRTELQLREGCV